ncbi:TPA: hypothetical protein P0E30_003738 [Vibrio harveyi]|nr:hypothetical protein [Vibrio harveyi]
MDQQEQLKQLRRDLENLTEYTNPQGRTALQVQIRQREGVERLKRLTSEAIHQNLRIKIMVLCEFLSKVAGISPQVLTLERLNDEIHKKLDELELIIE